MSARFQSSLSMQALSAYVVAQLNHFSPDQQPVTEADLLPLMKEVMARLEHCFAHVKNRYFFDGKSVSFSHLHGDQYAMFLYLLSRVAYEQRVDAHIPAKLFLLNKSLHAIDAYFEVELPSVFLFVHPLGAVLGRACYSDYLIVYQRCGVGSNHDVYPKLGRFVTLHPGSSVLGKCHIGDNVSIAAESLVIDQDIDSDNLYIGNPRNFMTKSKTNFPEIWDKP